MAILYKNSSNFMLSLKVLLISTGVLTIAMVLKLSVPVITDHAISEVPVIWNVVVSWLRPPYLYLVINCIIITIVASSKLQSNSKVDDYSIPTEMLVQVQPMPVKISEDVRTDYEVAYNGVVLKNEEVEVVTPEVFEYGYDVKETKVSDFDVFEDVDARVWETKETIAVNAPEESEEFVVSKSSRTTLSKDPTVQMIPTEKPPVSARFGHRKTLKASPEGGKTLRVSKPKKHETLEGTWKTITEGRSMPLTRHLRKSDTWETTHGRHHQSHVDLSPEDHKMIKSETFNDRSTSNNSSLSPSPGSGKLKRESSLSQDDLNKRVEAFIKKFNEEMRLQRQESLNQYMEMINRGAH